MEFSAVAVAELDPFHLHYRCSLEIRAESCVIIYI